MNIYLLKSKTKLLLIIVSIIGTIFCGTDVSAQSALENKKSLLNFFEATYGSKLITGENHYVHTPVTYDSLGLKGAVCGSDIKNVDDVSSKIKEVKAAGCILSLHWHWHLNEDSAWKNKRKVPVNVAGLHKANTADGEAFRQELSNVADKLIQFQNAGIVILWRPLHEIDGGWFWWTDKKEPENTRALWLYMHDYLTKERGINNLIWVYSISTGFKGTVEFRKRFYPGDDFTDIVGVDAYDLNTDIIKRLKAYKELLTKLAPFKMHALPETDNIPAEIFEIDLNEQPWLYVMPWWGAPSNKHPLEKAKRGYGNPLSINLSNLPKMWNYESNPYVGLQPLATTLTNWVDKEGSELSYYIRDHDNKIDELSLLVNNKAFITLDASNDTYYFKPEEAGIYNVALRMRLKNGTYKYSNSALLIFGKDDLAKVADIETSSGDNLSNALDNEVDTYWESSKDDKQTIKIDLARDHNVEALILTWGWKIHPSQLRVAAFSSDGTKVASTTLKDPTYQQWKKTHVLDLVSDNVRFIEITLLERAAGQKWGGYKLNKIEVVGAPGQISIIDTFKKLSLSSKLLAFIFFAMLFVCIFLVCKRIKLFQLLRN